MRLFGGRQLISLVEAINSSVHKLVLLLHAGGQRGRQPSKTIRAKLLLDDQDEFDDPFKIAVNRKQLTKQALYKKTKTKK
ncbi:MAG TPA: hypothetical protein VD998_02255 [Verrucomicrobiae bacterium]|nr:hypothetical protein [Verrucomicrobiae bacterium]